MSTSPDNSDLVDFAAAFGTALHSGDFGAAHAMLSATLADMTAASELSDEYNVLADDMGGVTGVGQPVVMLQDWPGMTEQDRAMVYVPLDGDMFSEAVMVTVSESPNGLCISGLEWGRP